MFNHLLCTIVICAIVMQQLVAINAFTIPTVPKITKRRSRQNQRITVLSASSSSTEKREPWDFFRFVKQSSKFISIFPKPVSEPTKVNPGDILWSQSTSSSAPFSWGPLDDVVMGGISSSTFDNAKGKWIGFVTDKNSGGFIGIRSTPLRKALDMSNCEGVEFTLKGIGSNQFKAVIRDSTDFNGITWTGTFGGASKWGLWSTNNNDKVTKVKIPFETLIPAIFAKIVPNQVLKKENIVGFQLVYSKFLFDGDLNPDFKVGEFDLEVIELKAY